MSDRRVLVVADHEDVGTRVAARAAASFLRDAAPIVISGEDLAASQWRHRVTSYGVATTTLRVPGVGDLRDDDLAGVLYRSCRPLVPPGLRHAPERDRGYAASELTALVTSWLLSLGPRVMNAAEGASPQGPTWSPEVWLRSAAAADFRVAAGPVDRTILVAGDRIAGAADDQESERARRLSGLTRCRLLEMSLTEEGAVVRVTCLPPLVDPTSRSLLTAALVDLTSRGTEEAA